MKKINKLFPLGALFVTGLTILPLTACTPEDVWFDSRTKKVRFVPVEKTILVKSTDKEIVIPFTIDRELAETDVISVLTDLPSGLVNLKSKDVETPNVKLTYTITVSQLPEAGVTGKFVFSCLNYKAICSDSIEIKLEK